MDDYLTILRKEFDAEEGSFLLKFRCFAEWDKEAFARIIQAMEQCARDHEGREVIETWIARGFWFLETTTTGLVYRPERRSAEDDDYYRRACARLGDLSYWLFFGGSPFEGPTPPM
jgi:hypothetical protein